MTKRKKLNREKTYNANIKILKEVNMNLFSCLKKELQKPLWIEPIRSKNGDPNLQVKANTNEVRPAYELDSPRRIPRETVKGFNFFKETASILIGIGAGHLLKQMITKKEEKHIIIVIEPELYLIKYALHNYDFSKWIFNGTLLFAINEEEALELIKDINWLDILFVILLLGMIYKGARTGVGGQLLSLAGWCLLLFTSITYYNIVSTAIFGFLLQKWAKPITFFAIALIIFNSIDINP